MRGMLQGRYMFFWQGRWFLLMSSYVGWQVFFCTSLRKYASNMLKPSCYDNRYNQSTEAVIQTRVTNILTAFIFNNASSLDTDNGRLSYASAFHEGWEVLSVDDQLMKIAVNISLWNVQRLLSRNLLFIYGFGNGYERMSTHCRCKSL